MADQKQALFLALAWFLLAGPFPKGEATGPRCKKQPPRERKPTFETFHWQEAYLPLAVIVGGCCGLVWWVLLVIYDVSLKGGQKGLPQISGEVEPVEQKTTALEHLEEWSDTEIRLDCRVVSKGNVSAPVVELEPCPPSQPKEQSPPSQPMEESPPSQPKEESPPTPSQPKEQSPTTFWTYLEQELERILFAVRSHRTTEQQSPVPEERSNTLPVEKLDNLIGDWQNILAQFKQLPLFVQGQSCPAVDKQEPPSKEGQSSLVQEKQQPPTEEGHSSLVEDKQSSPSGQKHVSLAKKRKKTPRRARKRSKSKCKASPSSRNRKRSSSRSKSSSSCSRRRGRCSKLCSKRK
uniref:Uncharacterized protein n=1 Tax=Sphaerodactylus townsendi TaxID=933632 RepID=A0ACB8G8M2_9SAUR